MKKKTILGIAALLSAIPLSHASAMEVVDTTKVHRMDELVVTGSNQSIRKDLIPYTVSVVNELELQSATQPQLLSIISGQVPSLFVSERNIFGFGVSSGGAGAIKIRGVGGSPTNAVLMMVDGQPQFAGIYSHHIADFYGTDYVEKVEVLRGPGSVLYGSNAMGGVINVITKQAKKDGVHTTLSTQYGSYNTWRSSLTKTIRKGKFSSVVALNYDRTDGVEDGFDFKQGSGYIKLGYNFNECWTLNADYMLMNFIGDDPVYPKLSKPESTDVYHQNIIRGEASMMLTNRSEKTNGSVRVYYSYGNHFIDDPTHFHSKDDRFGVLAYQNFAPWEGASATLGFDFDTYSGQIPMSGGKEHTEGSMMTIGHKRITEYSPYLTFAQNLFHGMLTLNGGLRMANSDCFDTQWIPQGGMVVRPGDGWLLKASLAKGYRNPSFRELYLYKPANPDLDPETMMNYEVTIGKTFSRYFQIDVTGYYSHGDNLIQTVNMKNVNTGEFTNKGVEASAESQPTDKLNLRASYSYLHTSLNNLTAAPKNQYFLGIGWQALPQLRLDAELKGVGGLYVSDDAEHQSYTLLNLKAAYQVLPTLELFASLNNLTDAKYTINKGYQMPGFNAMGGVKFHF